MQMQLKYRESSEQTACIFIYVYIYTNTFICVFFFSSCWIRISHKFAYVNFHISIETKKISVNENIRAAYISLHDSMSLSHSGHAFVRLFSLNSKYLMHVSKSLSTTMSFVTPTKHLVLCVFFFSLFFQFYSLAFLLFFLFDLVLIADIKHIPLHLHHPNTRLITVWRFVAIHFIKLHNLNEANRKWRKYSVQLIVWLLNGPSDFLEMCFFLYFYFIFAFDFGFFRCCFRCWCWCLFLVAVILTLNRHNFRKAGDFKRIESCSAANGWMYAMRSNVKLCDLNWNRHKMF